MSFSNSYILLLFLVIPLYAPFGYVGLGDAKVRLYVVAATLLGVLAFGQAMWRWLHIAFFRIGKEKKKLLADSGKLCVAWRTALLLLLLSLIVSSVQSADFLDAWRGSDGWLMGLLVQGLSILFAFFLSFPQAAGKEKNLAFFLKFCLYAGGSITILLGILNRFRIYPFAYMRVDSSFLSTLGNIDWFCGYLAVVVPFAMGDLYLSRVETLQHLQGKSWRQRFDGLGMLIGAKMVFVAASFFMIILLGAESAYLILGAGFWILLLVSVWNRTGRMAFLEQLIAFCLLPAILHGLVVNRTQILDSYLWEDETRISVVLILHWYRILLAIAAAMLLVWIYEFRKLRREAAGRRGKIEKGETIERREEAGIVEIGIEEGRTENKRQAEQDRQETYGKRPQLLMCLAGGIGAALLLMLLALQLFFPDFFSGRFGSSRGMIWQVCSRMFLNFSLPQKLFGIGPDCLYPYLLAHPEYREVLLSRFGVDLMNAHSVLLQRLLTTGIVGTALYLLVIMIAFRIFCSHEKSLPYIMMLSAYLLTGAVLFEQITSFPLMLALLGIGVREAAGSAILRI